MQNPSIGKCVEFVQQNWSFYLKLQFSRNRLALKKESPDMKERRDRSVFKCKVYILLSRRIFRIDIFDRYSCFRKCSVTTSYM